MSEYPHVSLFLKGIYGTTPDKSISLEDILSIIKEGKIGMAEKIKELRTCVALNGEKSNSYEDFKLPLPAFTPSGCFEPTRNNKSIKEYSKFTIIDIDGLFKQGISIIEIQKRVKNIPESFVGFISPSGDGYKIIVRVNTEAKDHHTTTKTIMDFYQKRLGVKIDEGGKDIARLCFLSFDPELYFNKDALIFNISNDLPMDEKIKRAEAYTLNLSKFDQGKRNDFIYKLGCNLNRFGVLKADAIDFAISNYNQSNFSENEIERTIKSAYQNTKEHSTQENTKPSKKDSLNLEITDLDRIENELRLHEINSDGPGIAKILISCLEDDETGISLCDLAKENSRILAGEFPIRTNSMGKILKALFIDKDTDIDHLLKHSSARVRDLTKKILDEKFDYRQFDIIALRIVILRFKVEKIKLAYNRLLKSSMNQPSQSMLKTERELENLTELNNKWVGQIKGLFILYDGRPNKT